MLIRLLLTVEPAALRERLLRLLSQLDVVVTVEPTAADPLARIRHGSVDLLMLDRRTLETLGEGGVGQVRGLPDAPELIVVTEEEDSETRARWLAAGCLSVLPANVSDHALSAAIEAAVRRRRESLAPGLRLTRDAARPQLADFVSASPAMQSFLSVVERVAPSGTSLLIGGETGVGKERLARAIHAVGPRAQGPFVSVNCGALPESLLESELFGHEEGAFTGALRARRGWFELAHGGTIFLDEIGEMPLHLQVKLLAVLQSHEVQRLGSERAVRVDVRVIAATNRDLIADVEQGRFRRDLFYRLGVIHLIIPPLRERKEDIPALVNDYVRHFAATIGRHVTRAEPRAIQALMAYPWPGNVRELINIVERAVLLCEGPAIQLHDLPPGILHVAPQGGQPPSSEPTLSYRQQWLELPLREARQQVLESFERTYLSHLLERTRGRVGQAAKLAGIDPRTLFQRLRQYQLNKDDYKPPKTT